MIGIEQTFEHLVVVKRSGQRVAFNGAKIAVAVKHAFDSVYEIYDEKDVNHVYKAVLDYIATEYEDRKTINVEDIQDIIETTLQHEKFTSVYLSFNEYRLRRAASREVFSVKQQHKFVKAIEKIGLTVKNNKEDKPMDLMFKFAKNISKEFSKAYLLENKYVRAHEEGILAIGDLDSYALATTSSSYLDLGYLEADNVNDFTDKILSILRHIKEEQYGEHSLPSLDHLYQKILITTYKNIFKRNLYLLLEAEGLLDFLDIEKLNREIDAVESTEEEPSVFKAYFSNQKLSYLFHFSYRRATEETEKKLHEAFKKLLEEIDDFHFKLGKNTVSISLGAEKTREASWIQRVYLEELLKQKVHNIETIYKLENLEAPHLELLISSILHNKNLHLYLLKDSKQNKNKEVFSSGECVYHNINHDMQTSYGRMIISASSINLARLALMYPNQKDFYEALEDTLELCKNQLMGRLEIEGSKYKENYAYLFGNPILFDAKKLEDGQKIRKVLRHGALEIGFVGLGECICALLDKKVLEADDFKVGKEIITFMKEKVLKFTSDNKLNFILAETEDTQIQKSLLAIDKSVFGAIDILKKNKYDTISHYLKKLNRKDAFEIGNLYEKEVCMQMKVYQGKNTTAKKIKEIIEDALAEDIGYIKVEVDT